MAYTIDMFGRKHVYNKKVLRFGSYGWSGGAQKEFEELVEKWKLKWTMVNPIEWEGAPTEETHQQAFQAAAALAREVKQVVKA
jgi:flavorubredoxin